VEALRSNAITVQSQSSNHAYVSRDGALVNLTATDHGIEVSMYAMGSPISCTQLRQATPLLREIVTVVQQKCLGTASATATETWTKMLAACKSCLNPTFQRTATPPLN
jgi:hypothetical protein